MPRPVSRHPTRTAACLAAVLLSLALSTAPAGATSRVERVQDFARAGAPDLALSWMDRLQPAFEQQPDEWLRWERARLTVLESMRDWNALVSRVGDRPSSLPDAADDELVLYAVRAHLEAGDGAAARRELRRLLWRAQPSSGGRLRELRRHVVRSYLVDARIEDALTAMQRYRQDYGDGAPEWRRLRARVLIRAGRAGEAATLLDGKTDAHARALRLLATARAGTGPPDVVQEAATELLTDAELDPRVAGLAAAARVEAMRHSGDTVAYIGALESLLALAPRARSDPLFDIGPDVLWQAYIEHGRALGNDRQLLVGDDAKWYFAATEAMEAERWYAARGLLAVLADTSQAAEHRAMAHEYLAEVVARDEHGDALLRRLYLDARRFERPEDVPAPVRRRLVDIVLADGDTELASTLMAGLEEPPAGADRWRWATRRARVLILGGRPEDGTQALSALLAGMETIEPAQVDRVVQIVFDLQKLSRHEAALEFLERLMALGVEGQRRRELLFWMGDSHAALERHEAAAYHYLSSATLESPFTMDRWAQTARFHAAENLAAAGFVSDAQRIYRGLLNAASDTAQRARLRRKIETAGAGG